MVYENIIWTPIEPTDAKFLNRLEAGSFLKLDNGKIMLVGDINVERGVCNDCSPHEKVIAISNVVVEFPT